MMSILPGVKTKADIEAETMRKTRIPHTRPHWMGLASFDAVCKLETKAKAGFANAFAA